MGKYKYNSPYEWLNERIIKADEKELRVIAHELTTKINADDIQDLFQSEMDADGYFEEIE